MSLFFKLTTGYDISVVVVESVEIATNQVLFHAMWFKSFFIRDSIFSSSIHGVPTAIVIGFACSLKVSLGRGGVEPNILSTSNIIMSIIYTFLFCEILFSLSDEKRKSLNLDAFNFSQNSYITIYNFGGDLCHIFITFNTHSLCQ